MDPTDNKNKMKMEKKPWGGKGNKIDYVLISKIFTHALIQAETYYKADLCSGYILVGTFFTHALI